MIMMNSKIIATLALCGLSTVLASNDLPSEGEMFFWPKVTPSKFKKGDVILADASLKMKPRQDPLTSYSYVEIQDFNQDKTKFDFRIVGGTRCGYDYGFIRHTIAFEPFQEFRNSPLSAAKFEVGVKVIFNDRSGINKSFNTPEGLEILKVNGNMMTLKGKGMTHHVPKDQLRILCTEFFKVPKDRAAEIIAATKLRALKEKNKSWETKAKEQNERETQKIFGGKKIWDEITRWTKRKKQVTDGCDACDAAKKDERFDEFKGDKSNRWEITMARCHREVSRKNNSGICGYSTEIPGYNPYLYAN